MQFVRVLALLLRSGDMPSNERTTDGIFRPMDDERFRDAP